MKNGKILQILTTPVKQIQEIMHMRKKSHSEGLTGLGTHEDVYI